MAEKKNVKIGDFIIQKLNLEKDKVYKFLNMQSYLDDKVGEIALEEKHITEKELGKILSLQKSQKLTFGCAAISLGYMKSSQLKLVLDIQAQNKQRIGELLVKEGIITQENLFKILDEYYTENKKQFNIISFAHNSVNQEIQNVLKPYHYGFTACNDEEKLSALIKKVKPHLIVLDKEKGRFTKVIKNIKESKESSHIKIALLSRSKEIFKMVTGYEIGIDYFLPLPFEAKHFINIIIDSEIQHAKRQKKRILIVDDSHLVRLSIAQELQQSGYQILTATNGEEAVEIALLEKPDLITMDINMPVMNGYEACHAIKSNHITKNIPIIILTSNNTQQEREKGFAVGAIEYFTKPFTKGYLRNYINHLLTSSGKTREEKLLVADDSLICRNIFSAVFNKYGYQHEMVDNGQAVIDYLEKGYTPSTILLDYQMPIMDGLEACKILKQDERYRNIPIIIVTGSSEKDDVLKALKIGADDYLIKPFDGDELIARIETHIRNFTLLEKLKQQNQLLRENEKALMEAQAYSRNIIDSSIDMIITCDNDQKIVEFNKAAEATFGYKKEEIVGKDFSLLYADEKAELRVQKELKETGKFYGESLEKRKNGAIFPASISASLLKDAHGKVILGTMGVSRDITKLKLAEEDARKTHIKLKSAYEELEKKNDFIRKTFGRYISDDVVDTILDSSQGLTLGGEKREVTIMMTDLRGFTSLSENSSAEEVVNLLNIYFEIMTEIILKYQGTIDEFIGDAILAIFGAPLQRSNDVERAVACALEMQLAMEEVNRRNKEAGYPCVEMGIGINTGEVVVGNIGSRKRTKYGVVGSNVNLTSRIESYTVGGQIFVSEGTLNACGKMLTVKDKIEIMPKGFAKPITIADVIGISGEYDIHLHKGKAVKLTKLKKPLTIKFNILEGKHAGQDLHSGTITKLSNKLAEIETSVKMNKLENLEITLYDDKGKEVATNLYAKITDKDSAHPKIFRITFTSVPDKAANFFNDLGKKNS
ncbi:MAG: response regulator [Nitrospinae bacterium]|nr:response regulator [Nitrospinota bacterium]